MRDEELFAEAVEPHVEPASPSFFEAFWREAEQRQRRAARRWRAAAIAFAVAAFAATTAAGVVASRSRAQSVVDRTLGCKPLQYANGPQIAIHASVQSKQSDAYFHLTVAPPLESVQLGPTAVHFDVSSGQATFGTQQCTVVHDQPLFAARGLPADNVYTTTFLGRFLAECTTASRILIRTHVVFAHGGPVAAKVVVVDAATGRPRAYVVWSPTRIVDWLDKRCYRAAY